MAKTDKKPIIFDFYTLEHLFKQCPREEFYYYVIIGERSNGKTFSVQEYALREYLKTGKQLAYVRRWESDWEKGNTTKVWEHFIDNPYRGNIIEELTKGKYNSISYNLGAWTLVKRATKNFEDEKGYKHKIGDILEKDSSPFGYLFSLNLAEHYKGTSYPRVGTILFDEFITRGYYLHGGEEFVEWQGLISTIVRLETTARIFMLANTISTQCPYFREMGIRHIKDMKPGQIDVYEYGDSGLKVAVEMTQNDASRKNKKKSNIFFAFDNPRLAMIRGDGDSLWEIDIYPHAPKDFKYEKKDIKYIFFIVYEGETLQGEVVWKNQALFTFIHRKTTPIKPDNKNLVFTPEYNPLPWYIRRIGKIESPLQRIIATQFATERVYYQDNEVGESVKHYLDWADNNA